MSKNISKEKIRKIRNDLADTRVKTKDLTPVVMSMSDDEMLALRKSFDVHNPKVSQLPEDDNAAALRKISGFLDLVTMRVAPNMPDDRLERYSRSMIVALEDLPWSPLSAALDELKSAPFRFIQDIEKQIRAKVRELSSSEHHDRRLGFTRFLELKDKREQAALPKPEPEPLSIEEIASMSGDMVRIGLSLGEITQEQVKEAEKLHFSQIIENEGNGRLSEGLGKVVSDLQK